MAVVLDVLSWASILVGAFFCIVGSYGLIRLPELYCRMHAAGVVDTAGIGFILLGLALQAGWTLALAKLLMILLFVLLTSPTTCHALCRAAAYAGIHPLHGERAPETDSDDGGSEPSKT